MTSYADVRGGAAVVISLKELLGSLVNEEDVKRRHDQELRDLLDEEIYESPVPVD